MTELSEYVDRMRAQLKRKVSARAPFELPPSRQNPAHGDDEKLYREASELLDRDILDRLNIEAQSDPLDPGSQMPVPGAPSQEVTHPKDVPVTITRIKVMRGIVGQMATICSSPTGLIADGTGELGQLLYLNCHVLPLIDAHKYDQNVQWISRNLIRRYGIRYSDSVSALPKNDLHAFIVYFVQFLTLGYIHEDIPGTKGNLHAFDASFSLSVSDANPRMSTEDAFKYIDANRKLLSKNYGVRLSRLGSKSTIKSCYYEHFDDPKFSNLSALPEAQRKYEEQRLFYAVSHVVAANYIRQLIFELCRVESVKDLKQH